MSTTTNVTVKPNDDRSIDYVGLMTSQTVGSETDDGSSKSLDASNPPVPSGTALSTVVYERKISLERAVTDDDVVVPKSRKEYVAEFTLRLVKTAQSTLEMCRVVYEAHRSLDHWEFKDFCKEIGYRESSSTIRKYIAIGKVYPRLIQYADQLPASWTSIYLITQLPADTFEQMLNDGESLSSLTGKELDTLVRSTRSVESLSAPLPIDKGTRNFVFGKLMFTKVPDDTDWRAMHKALAELEARLPIRFAVNTEAEWIWQERKLARYEHGKCKDQAIEFKPELWDLGRDADAAEPKPENGAKKTITQKAA